MKFLVLAAAAVSLACASPPYTISERAGFLGEHNEAICTSYLGDDATLDECKAFFQSAIDRCPL